MKVLFRGHFQEHLIHLHDTWLTRNSVYSAQVATLLKFKKNRRNNLRIDFKSSYWEKKANGTVTELKIEVIEVDTSKIPSIRKSCLKIQCKSVSQRFRCMAYYLEMLLQKDESMFPK